MAQLSTTIIGMWLKLGIAESPRCPDDSPLIYQWHLTRSLLPVSWAIVPPCILLPFFLDNRLISLVSGISFASLLVASHIAAAIWLRAVPCRRNLEFARCITTGVEWLVAGGILVLFAASPTS